MSQKPRATKTKKNEKLNKEKDRQREELEKRVRKRVAFEEKAFRLVERLIENTVSTDLLLEAGLQIDQTQYDDIVEERTISNLCGYPVCHNQLKVVPKQKYRISTKTNKVYDITDRKKYCSSQCYKASTYFKNQIPTSPVWLRETEPTPTLQLLEDRHNKGSAGELVTENPRTQLLIDVENKPDSGHQKCMTVHNLAKDMCNMHVNRDLQGESDGPTYAVVDKDGVVAEVKSCDIENTMERVNNLNSDNATLQTCDTSPGNSQFACPRLQTESQSNEEEVIKKVEERIAMKKEALYPSQKVIEQPYAGVETVDRMSQIKKNKTDVLMELLDKRETLLIQINEPQQQEKDTEKVCETTHLEERMMNKNESKQGHAGNDNSTNINTCSRETYHNSNVNHNHKENVSSVRENSNSTSFSGQDSNRESKSSKYLQNIQRAKQQKKHLEASQKPKETNKQKRGKDDSTANPSENAFENLRRLFHEWKTEETVRYLSGSSSKTTQEVEKEEFQRRYEELGRRVDRQMGELSEVIGEVDPHEDEYIVPAQKLPDFESLKRETQKYEVKVQEYFKGNLTESQEGLDEKQDVSSIRLPPVDSHSQNAIRRKIVLDKVSNKVPDLLDPLRMTVSDVSKEIREIVYTFRFTSTNIVLRPVQWTLVTYIILRLLCLKVAPLKAAFEDTYSSHYLSSMLLSVGITESNVATLLEHITTSQPDQIA